VVSVRREPEQLETRQNLKRWLDAISERPAVKKGVAVMADLPQQPLTDEQRSILYGNKQFEKR
jgi:GST-like protein